MWEDAFSQWVNDPGVLDDSFVLLGAVNGDNGDRETGGRGQKVYIAEGEATADAASNTSLVCN